EIEAAAAEAEEDARPVDVVEAGLLGQRAGSHEQRDRAFELAEAHARPRLCEKRPEGEPRLTRPRGMRVGEERDRLRIVVVLERLLGLLDEHGAEAVQLELGDEGDGAHALDIRPRVSGCVPRLAPWDRGGTLTGWNGAA